jgi:hypothetical protein
MFGVGGKYRPLLKCAEMRQIPIHEAPVRMGLLFATEFLGRGFET